MVGVCECDDCKYLLPLLDGWKMACKAYPDGIPLEVVFPKSLDIYKDCGNGYCHVSKD